MTAAPRSFALILALSATAACVVEPQPESDQLRAQDEPKEKDPKKGCEPACTALDCPCDEADDSCDPGLFCKAGACAAPVCADGIIEGPEDCEDGNLIDGDGCDSDCSYTQILDLVASHGHTCALIEGGRIRCWGSNTTAQLGLGHTQNIGDDEQVADGGDALLEVPARQLLVGNGSTCALLDGGLVRCWGTNWNGMAGYGINVYRIGDDEPLDWYGNVFLNGRATEFASTSTANCALFESGDVRCWGSNYNWNLGLGVSDVWYYLGDDEYPAHVAPVNLGGPARQLATGNSAYHMCAITEVGELRCWGRNTYGQLGQGNYLNAYSPGPAVSAIAAGLPPETEIVDVAISYRNTCVVYDSGDVLCWGAGSNGENGQGSNQSITFPGGQPPIDLGGRHVVDVESGYWHFCALTDVGEVLCWGNNGRGQLGAGIPGNVGDDETPGELGATLDFGGVRVRDIALGGLRTCVLLENNQVYCTGDNTYGELGHGDTVHGLPSVALADTPPLQIF